MLNKYDSKPMKLHLFQEFLKISKIDLVILVHPDPNIIYFAQAKPSYCLALIYPTKSELYVSKLDAVSKHFKVLPKDWKKEFAKIKAKKIGINKESLTLSFYETLKTIFKAEFVDISDQLKKLRQIKTPEEIDKITKASEITSLVFDKTVAELKKNRFKTELQVANFIDNNIKQLGGELAFPTIVAMGKNAAIPHHITSQNKLSKGFLLMDFGASFQYYSSDMTQVVYLGKPSQEEKEIYNLLLKVQEKAINSVKSHLSLSELDKQVRKDLGKYSSNFIHSLGHGVGIEVHESPRISPESKEVVQKNQVFTIEPGIYFHNKFGLRMEDTLWFDGSKSIVLTKVRKELIII